MGVCVYAVPTYSGVVIMYAPLTVGSSCCLCGSVVFQIQDYVKEVVCELRNLKKNCFISQEAKLLLCKLEDTVDINLKTIIKDVYGFV
jgi:hypothetical protein